MNLGEGKNIELDNLSDLEKTSNSLKKYNDTSKKGIRALFDLSQGKSYDFFQDANNQYDAMTSNWGIKKDSPKYKELKEHLGQIDDGDYDSVITRHKLPGYDKVKLNKYNPNELNGLIKSGTGIGSRNRFNDTQSFANHLNNNGYKVKYFENISGTWQNDDGGGHYKDYLVTLKDGKTINFRIYADKDYNTTETNAFISKQ